MDKQKRVWIARVLVGMVFFFNVQSALAFFIAPQNFAPGFELSGSIGAGVVRAFGLLFLMWNVPYAVALIHPIQRRVSLYEATAMQVIGLLGEMVLLLTIPLGHPAVQATITRFIWFDAGGLVALILAVILTSTLVSIPAHKR